MNRLLLVVGVDGLPPALLRKLIDDGRTPNLARLAENGSLGVLRSTPNYQSASAWTSLVTGVNPGRHGIIHFTNPVRGGYRFARTDARARRAPSNSYAACCLRERRLARSASVATTSPPPGGGDRRTCAEQRDMSKESAR